MSNYTVITLNKLSKVFGGHKALNEISLEIQKGDIIGIIGPSGGGKSTLLRCIAGVESYSSGTIKIDPECRIGMVFQNFNLFKNMSVIDNLCYPQQKVLNRSREDSEGISIKILKKVNMLHYFNKYPDQLSDGQKQRVAIARTLCLDLSVILFDEPTSALGPENVLEILNVIKDVASEEIAILIISHELRFIEAITNKMIFMSNGNMEMFCDTKSFFKDNHNERVRSFLQACLRY
jgi:ABC-type polar amino acid transport system ATPase subunit